MSQYPTNPSASSAGPAGSGQLVLIGFALAIVAVILMNIYVEMRVAARDEAKVTFFKFEGDLDAGDEVQSKNLIPVQIPKSIESAFGSDAIREDVPGSGRPADGVGFKLNTAVVKGEVLRSSLFLSSGRRPNRNNPDVGEHQIAISVDSEDQPSDLMPGDYIDLYGAIPRSRSNKFMPVMEYVEVAAVGERRSETGDGTRSSKYGSITINIDPKQVPLLFDIQQRLPDQKFRISLRSPADKKTNFTGDKPTINPEVLRNLGLE